ncbi:beta-propeller fold lactonase family protein [uncultured Ornithinimicrobium sp.]|uniref:lactonase family protein n=1 Tax=uncultured Ornithinimicrobium sp. TaxID=259307 RepID=UPI00259A7FB4|nr:beta-propeller fold lactonase family protein [uncultured Ornithinimicrobium sp.]
MTLHLGGYTQDQPQDRSGWGRVDYDPTTGFGDAVALPGPPAPSWLVRLPGTEEGYAVSEADGGAVVRVHPEEGVVSSVDSGGMGPAHLALSPDGRWLVASNYVSGSVGLVAAGQELELVDELQLEGDGPHERQDSSHAHQAVFVGEDRLLVCDLGADRVAELRVEDGALRQVGQIVLAAGSGPRHLAPAPGRDDLLWVVGELDQTVHVVRREDGGAADGTGAAGGVGWRVVQTVTTAPEGPGPGETTTGGVVVSPDGRHVYVSTRGTDTVSVYAVDDEGLLELRQQVVTGHWPRFIGWVPGHEGDLLLVAAEREGSVDVWSTDEGLLERTGHSLAWAAPTWVG